MYKRFVRVIFLCLMLTLPVMVWAQQRDHLQIIQQRLDSLAVSNTGLKQSVQLAITGVSIQDYLIALGKTNNLSISVDPKLNFTVNDIFNNVTASNILEFLAKKYSLDMMVVGSIIYVTPYTDPGLTVKIPVKDIKVKYNSTGNTLTVDLDNDSLTAVAKKITDVSGKNVIVPTSLLGKRVTAFIAASPFDIAMDKLAYANDIKMVKTSDNFYLFQPLGENEELYVNGDRSTSVRHTFRPSAASTGGNSGLYTRIVNGQKLISADAVGGSLLDLVKQASQEMNKSYSIYSDIKGTITVHVNDVSYENFLNILFKGTEYTYHAENEVFLIGDRKLEGLRTYKMIKLQHRSLDTVMAAIPTDWKKGVEIKEFREQNSLLISGSGAQINEIENFLKQLDELVPVVLIEVTIIDINKSRTVSTGVAAGVSDSVKTGGTILPGVNFTFSASSFNNFLSSISKFSGVNLGHVVPNFYVSLNALETNGDIDVRSVPKLSALNGHAATMSIGNTIYWKNTTQNVIPSTVTSQSIFTNTYQPSQANLEISIKPEVSGDEQVTLKITVGISDFTSIPTDGSPPPTSNSKFETSLRVHNEDTIVLGGIERTEHDDNVSGTPLLSRIPILKFFFSNKTKSTKKVITVLFIKPTIIR